MVASWDELGSRIAAARKAARWTQEELANAIGVDRTIMTKIESGSRQVDALELARLAEVLGQPIPWFLDKPPIAVVSRRQERGAEAEGQADLLLEALAADVGFLVGRKLLPTNDERPRLGKITNVAEAEAASVETRKFLECPTSPIVDDLVDVAENLGLYVFVLQLPEERLDGSSVALEQCGVALIQGSSDVGRRRFTLCHELGHHLLQDAYSAEWIKAFEGNERERLINAFAVHFLVPRQAATARWTDLKGERDTWNAAVNLAAEYGVSWSALCAHLKNLRLISEADRKEIEPRVPGYMDFLERGLKISPEPRAPTVPRGYAAAVIKGFRRHKLGRVRVFEMLHGTILPQDMGQPHDVPLDAMKGELEPPR